MNLPQEDLELKKAFGIILSIESFSDYISDIAELIYNGMLDRANLDKILKEYDILKIDSIKEETLDLLIVYINLILNDQIITENERRNIQMLKKYFKIKEGDFYKYRKAEVEEILQRQFTRLYCDNIIEDTEALYNIELQWLFDLSYDQFDAFKENEVIRSIESGADISDLDTAKFPDSTRVSKEISDRSISQQVRDLVWNRDGGRCRICGSN